MIPEESDEELPVTVKGDGDEVDTIPYTPGDLEEEQFNTAIDDTSDDPMIVMGKPLTTAFVSSNVRIPTEKVGCLQVTNQLRKFLNHFPRESKEKAFEQIYEILHMLNAYLIDNPQQHIHCMSPDNEYVSLIMYAITIEIDLCNFPAIWAVLSILLHMLVFYGKKTNPRAGLLHDQGVIPSKAIADIPTWMGYFARWRVRCVSVSEASEILAGCKRLEKENWRRAHWDLQHRLSSMQLNSPLSATARPFQPQAAPSLALVDDIPGDYPAQNGLARGSPNWGSTTGLPVRGAAPNHHYTSSEEGVSTDTTTSEKSLCKRRGSRRNRGVVVTPMRLSPPEGGKRKRMGSLVRSRSLNLGARRAILMMWLMPLGSGPVVSLIIMNTMRIPTLCS